MRYSFAAMEDLLPEFVLESLRDHYYASVTAAELGYGHHSRNENSATGALGQALFTPGIRVIANRWPCLPLAGIPRSPEHQGPGTAEHEFGGDGVFQLEVPDPEGHVLRRKALMFQAKMEWRGANTKLLKQAEDMVACTPSAIVVDYRQIGFTGVAAVDVIEAGGNRRNIPQERQKRLAEILGDGFVPCRRGQVGVFWTQVGGRGQRQRITRAGNGGRYTTRQKRENERRPNGELAVARPSAGAAQQNARREYSERTP